MIKAKLYDLLSAFIQFEQPMILAKISQSKILNYIIIDYDKFENNSNMLILLNSCVKSMLNIKDAKLRDKILFELNLIQIFSRKLEHPDYLLSQSTRKNIYPFIHNLTVAIYAASE